MRNWYLQKAMILSMLFLLLFITGISFLESAEKISKPDDSQIYVYDRTRGEFWGVPNSFEGVDNLLAISYEERNKNEPEKAAYAVLQALNMAEQLAYVAGEAKAYFSLGELYEMFMDYPQALKEYQSALDVEKRLQRKIRIGMVLNKVGTVYIKQNEYRYARDYFEQTNELLNDTSYDLTKAEALSGLGQVHFHLKDYKASLEYYDQVQVLPSNSKDAEKIKITALMNAGNTYRESSEYENAENFLNQAVHYFEQHDHVVDQSEGHLHLAKLYLAWNKLEEALGHTHRSMELAESIEQETLKMEGYRLLSSIYEDQNNTQQALLNYQLYHTLHNELLNSEREARLTQRQIQHEVAQQNREIRQLNQKAALQEAEVAYQVLWRNVVLIGFGFVVMVAGLLFRNIHIKKLAHQRLQEKQEEIERKNSELIHLNQKKDEFLEMAAHDLRNPLSAIRGVIELMEEDMKPESDTLELTDLIKTSTERMLGLVNNFLNVEADEKSSGTLNIVPVRIDKPLSRITKNFKKKAKEKQINLILNLKVIKPVMADENMLERVVENLVSNAIKFSPSGSRVEIFSATKKTHLDIMVKDSGPGITEEDQKRMFKRFSTLSNKPTAHESSTGLGLYIVKKFTEAMGGHVRCESEVGTGSTFIISLPLINESEIKKTTTSGSASKL